MKKSLSTVLSLILVSSMITLPTNVKAAARVEINAEKATTIELENYAEDFAKLIDKNATVTEGTSKVYNKVTGRDTLSNGGATYINNAAMPEGQTHISLEIPVSISKTGYYDVEFCVGGANTTRSSSKIDFEIQGGSVGTKIIGDRHVPSSPNTKYTGEVQATSATKTNKHKGIKTYLKEGDYTIKMNVYGTISSPTKINFIADYIKLTPYEPELVDETTKYFEFEDYDNMLIEDNSKAHGGKLNYNGWIYGTGKTFNVCIPMNIEESGDYNWEAVMTKSIGSQVSTLTLYVDGKEVVNNTSSGADISDTDGDGTIDFMSSNFPMHRYNSTETIHLEKGYREITLSVSNTSNDVYKYGADYFMIEKAVEGVTPIAPQGTTIEFEDYAEDFAKLIDKNATVTEGTSKVYNKVTGRDTLSNGGATYINNAAMPEGQTHISLEIPVSISKTGYYDVEFCVGGNATMNKSSIIDFEIKGGIIGTKTIGDRHVPSSPNTEYTGEVQATSATKTYKHKGIKTYLEEGRYILKTNIYGTRGDSSTINFIADYIKFSPFEPESVGFKKKYFEFEDYDNMLIEDNSKAHGGKLNYNGWIYGTGKTFNVCIPMNIEESGDYNWEAVMTKSVGNVSTLTLYVDGKEVAKNTSSGVNISDTDGDGTIDFMSSNFPMHRYNSTETIHLEKGYREITLSVSNTSDNLYKYGADYVAIEKYIEPLTAAAKENEKGDGFDITFNYPVEKEALADNVVILDAEGNGVDFEPSLSEDGLRYFVIPEASMASAMYSIIVKKDVVGVPGNAMTEDVITPIITGAKTYSGATLEYDLYMGGDAPYDSSVTYQNNVTSGNLITTAKSSATIGTTQTTIPAITGWYHIKADISYPKQTATVTVTMPDGGTFTRGAYSYIYITNATAFTDISIKADSDYIKNIKLSADSGSVVSRTAESQKTYEGIFNIVTTFFGDEKTTRGFAWSGTEDHTDMVIRYAKADAEWESYIEKEAEYEQYNGQLYYKADISNLEAGTKYVYMIGDKVDNVWTDKYEIETEKENNHDFSFIALTDPQGNSETIYSSYTQTLQAAMEDAPDTKFILELGDLVEAGYKEDYWKLFFNASQNYTATLPHMAIMGNHESKYGEDDESVPGKHFGLHFNNPKNGGKAAIGNLTTADVSSVDAKGNINNIEETIYSFDYGDAHFVALNTSSDWNTADTKKIIAAQKDWIKKDIDASDKKWTIVMMHQGLYPAKDSRYFGSREILEELFVECGVDLVLQGHDHMVSRTYPMKSGTIQTRENTDVITEDSGIVYFIPGVAATKRYDSLTSSPSYMNKIINTNNSQPTYAVFNVTEDKIEVVTKQVNGEVLDKFSIVEKPEITLSKNAAQKTVTAKAEYTKTVSGTAIAGFYQGGRMVKAAIKGKVTDAHSVEITAENIQEGDFDEVKIFIWNIETLEPYIAAKSLKLR